MRVITTDFVSFALDGLKVRDLVFVIYDAWGCTYSHCIN